MLPTWNLPFGSLGLLLHFVVAAGFTLRLIWRKLNITVTLAWISIIVFLPVAGLVLYNLFGSRKLGRRREKLGGRIRKHYIEAYRLVDEEIEPDDIDTDELFNDLSRALYDMTGFRPVEGNDIHLLKTDKDIFLKMIEDIERAEATVFAEFYIIHPKGYPVDVMKALEAAAERGVNVKLLADAIGSRPFFKSDWPERLRQAGVEVATSLPTGLLKSVSKRTDLRNHRKILVIDQKVGYIGSCNLTDPKLFKPEEGYWVDMMARVEGPFAESLSVVMAADFLYDHVGADFTQSDLKAFPTESIHPRKQGPAVAQLVPSGPEMGHAVIYEAIVAALFAATERVMIVTPYFVPDDALMMALGNACRRGVEVTLVVPADGDSIMVENASRAVFDDLLAAGVRIARFYGGMLHTKALLIDDDISFVGTVNMDMRSMNLNLEVTMIVYDGDFNTEMRELVDDYLSRSKFIDAEDFAQRGSWARFKENVFRLVSPLL